MYILINDIRAKYKLYFVLISGIIFISSLIFGCFRGSRFLGDKEHFLYNQNDKITFQGKLNKIEKKTKSYYLYFDNIITSDFVCDSNESIIVVSDSDNISINTTAVISGTVQKFNNSRNEGNFDEEEYLSSLGVLCKVNVSSIRCVEYEFSIVNDLYNFRNKICDVYSKYLEGEEVGIVTCLTLGVKNELELQAKELFKAAGLAHILAISGLHISVVGYSIYRLLRRIGLRFLFAGGFSSVIVIVYGLMCEQSVSVIRAIGMFILLMLADICGESYDMLNSVGILGLIILVLFPYSILNIGFIFSFGAVIGIAVIASPINEAYNTCCRIRFICRNKYSNVRTYSPSFKEILIKNLLSSLLIQLVTIPIVSYFYFEIPVFVLILNIIVIPFMSTLLTCSLLGGILGVFGLSFISKILLFVSSRIVYIYEALADLSISLPFSRIVTGKEKLWEIIVYYIVLIYGVKIILENIKTIKNCYENGKKIPYKKIRIRLIIICIVVSVFLFSVLYNRKEKCFEIDMLDVGQGDGIYISSEEGVNFFIDGGSSSEKEVYKYKISPFLKYYGIAHIDYWFVSHVDNDHISGLLEALDDGLRIDNIIVDKYMLSEDNYYKIEKRAKNNSTKIYVVSRGDLVGTESITFTILSAGDDAYNDINANSIVLLLEAYDNKFLFTGDISSEVEKNLIETYDLNDINLLKIAHHGSKNSSCKDFINEINPSISLISVGENNRYGHPSDETIQRLREADSIILRTDLCGRIKLYFDDYLLQCEEYIVN